MFDNNGNPKLVNEIQSYKLPWFNRFFYEMSWSKVQRSRILEERDILNAYFPSRVTWRDGATNVEIRMTTNSDNEYCLRVYLPDDFPNSVPDMVITESPQPMPDWQSGSQTHTRKRRDGFLRICHYRRARWDCDNYLYHVFLKGRLWLEAYEAHLRTSEPVDQFLRQMQLC